MKIDEKVLVCHNGHRRKFFASYTSIAWKVEAGENQKLDTPNNYIVLYHCADCGATLVYEIDETGHIVEEKVKV